MNATIEAPTETKPATETSAATPPPAETPSVMTPEQVDAVVGNLLKPKVTKLPEIQQQQPAKPKEKPPEKAPDKPADDKEINFANLRKKAEESEKRAAEREAELTKIREEYDTFKKNPIPKEFEEKLTAAEKRALEADERASRADLSESPAFQAQFQPGIQEAAGIMVEELKELGVEPADINSAIASWNKEQFAEWADSMPALSRDRFLRAHTEAVNLDAKRSRALADHRKTRASLDEQNRNAQKQQQEQYFASLKSERDSVFAEIEASHKELLADPDIRRQTGEMLDRAIGADGKGLSTRDMLSTLAHTHTLAHHFKRVEGERQKLSDELTEAKKTLAERDSFIATLNGSTPVPSGTTPPDKADVDSIVSKLLRPTVKG